MSSLEEILAPIVGQAGLYLESATVKRAGKRSVVEVIVDLPDDALGAVSLDALGEVSALLAPAIDEAVNGQYALEVSSPGTSRPLTQLRHFKRARTRLVRLSLRDGSVAEGRLTGADDDTLTFEDGRTVPLADIARGAIEVELSRPDTDLGDTSSQEER